MDRNELIEKNIKLVRCIAKKIKDKRNIPIDLDILVSHGYLGLIKAAETYEPGRAQFNTWAGMLIRGAIYDELRAQGPLNRCTIEAIRKINSAKDRKTMSTDELSIKTGLTKRRIRYATTALNKANQISLDIHDSNGLALSAIIKDVDERFTQIENNELCHALLEDTKLPERDRDIIIQYYFKDVPMEAIGKMYNITVPRVSQIIKQTLEALRKAAKRRGLTKETCNV